MKLKKTPFIFEKALNKELQAVVILASPHPISGYLFYYPKNKITDLNISKKDVMSYLISIGTVYPEKDAFPGQEDLKTDK